MMRKKSRVQGAIALVTALIFVLAVVFSACWDRGHTITFENQAADMVTITASGRYEASLDPHETKNLDLLHFSDDRLFEARNDNGDLLFSERLTWDELKDRDWTIVIKAQS